MAEITDTLPNVSIVVLMDENTELMPIFLNNYHSIEYPKDKLEWVIIDDSEKSNMDLFPFEENVIYIHMDNSKEYLEKIEFKEKDEEKNKFLKDYFMKTNTLPNGFKRDFGVGLTENDYVLHLDFDAHYDPKVLKKKLKFLQKSKLECVYCDSMLCYFNDKIYKTEESLRAFEGTILHTKEFWKKGGFEWHELYNEGNTFHYNKGNDRKMENYYDCIKFINMHNVNDYQYKEIKLDGKEIDKPDYLKTIVLKDNKIQHKLKKLFKKEFSILGLNSEIIDKFSEDKENILIDKKEKEKVILKKIKDFDKDFNLFLFNYKTEIWNIFKEISFDVILYETDKNFISMKEILDNNDYMFFENLFINKNYLIN